MGANKSGNEYVMGDAHTCSPIIEYIRDIGIKKKEKEGKEEKEKKRARREEGMELDLPKIHHRDTKAL